VTNQDGKRHTSHEKAGLVPPQSPLLSIIIPSRDYGHFIQDCLASLTPSPVKLQVIVVENGSHELDTALCELVDPHDFVLVHREEADLSAARNNGLQHAKGEFVVFLDADDAFDICEVVRVLQTQDCSDVDAIQFGKAERSTEHFSGRFGSDQSRLERATSPAQRLTKLSTGVGFLLREILTNTYSPVTGCFAFRRSTIEALDLRFAEGYIHEDHAFVFRFLCAAQWVLVHKPVALYKRQHPTSLSSSTPNTQSVAGYRHAAQQIHGFANSRNSARWTVTVAEEVIGTRLLYIAAKKRAGEARKHATIAGFIGAVGGAGLLLTRYFLLLPAVAWGAFIERFAEKRR